MEKKILSALFISAILLFAGCTSSVDTKITFKNLSSSKLYINFRGDLTIVDVGKTVEKRNLPKGTYAYNTTFSIPAGTTSTKVEGDVSGQVKINAGTKVLVLYSSNFSDGVYTISATQSSTDEIDAGTTGP